VTLAPAQPLTPSQNIELVASGCCLGCWSGLFLAENFDVGTQPPSTLYILDIRF
jgi:hypothetical protein